MHELLGKIKHQKGVKQKVFSVRQRYEYQSQLRPSLEDIFKKSNTKLAWKLTEYTKHIVDLILKADEKEYTNSNYALAWVVVSIS